MILLIKGGDDMAQSEAHIKASNKYNAKAYDRVSLMLPKGNRDTIRAYAESRGMSLNGYINKLIADDMGEALTVPNVEENKEINE